MTTKEGDDSDKTRVSYSGRWGWNSPTTSTDNETRGYYSVYVNDLFWHADAGTNYTNYTEQDMMELWARRNDKVENPERPWVKIDQRDGRDTYVYYANFDWYHYLFKDEHPSTSHSVSLSGGNSKVKYMLSGNYYSEEGLFRQDPDRLQRINFRSKISFDINKWLKISNNTSYYNYQYYYPGPSGVNTAFSLGTVHALASMMPYNPDGTSVYYTSLSKYSIMDGLPTIMNKGGHYNKDKTDNMSTTTELTWTPVKGLEIKGNFTYMFNTQHNLNRQVNTEYSQYPGEVQTLSTGSRFQDKLYEKTMMHNYYQANVYATYAHTWNEKHNFKAMAGFNWETKYLKDVSATGYNLLSETLMDLNLVGQDADGNERMEVGGGQNEYALLGFFGRINYDYKGRYLVEVSGRYDGTSRFEKNSRWGWFPSASVGWRISEEPFFGRAKNVVDNLKLRASFGSLGNQIITNNGSQVYYTYLRLITNHDFASFTFGDGSVGKYSSLGAPVASDLTWETAQQWDLGLDVSMLGNRFNLTADVYLRDTKDMLTEGIALPGVYGADSPNMNSADLRTKGYELTVNWRDQFQLAGKPFEYSIGFNISDYKSVITKYDNPERSFAKDYYEGMEIGEIWGFVTDGFFKTDEEAKAYAKEVDLSYSSGRLTGGWLAGDLKFVDLDGDGIWGIGGDTVDNPGDRKILGNSRPTFSYGINASIRWMGFDASVFFQGTGNHYWYPNGQTMNFWGCYSASYLSFMPIDFHGKVWSEDNPDAYFPRPRAYSATGGYLAKVNDHYLQNIRYLRLKNLTVGYTIPVSLTKKAGIDQIRVYFSGENLAYWSPLKKNTKYVDPEAAINRSSHAEFNRVYYPWPKTFMFGIDVTF